MYHRFCPTAQQRRLHGPLRDPDRAGNRANNNNISGRLGSGGEKFWAENEPSRSKGKADEKSLCDDINNNTKLIEFTYSRSRKMLNF
jgi:hypothetical protein